MNWQQILEEEIHRYQVLTNEALVHGSAAINSPLSWLGVIAVAVALWRFKLLK